MTLGDLERWMRANGILAVNIHFQDSFRVHVRESEATGFSCAQKAHQTLGEALREHVPAASTAGDLSDLLD